MPLESERREFRRLCEALVNEALHLPEWRDYEYVKGMPEFEAFSAFIRRQAAAGKARANKVAESKNARAKARRFTWDFYLLPLLERCSESGCEDVCGQLEGYLCRGQVDWTVIWQEVAPLPGFTTHSCPVELANRVTIRELTTGEKQRFGDFAKMIGFGQALALGLYGANFAMSWWPPEPKASPASQRTGDDDFGTVLTALRLLKPGVVWYNMRGHWPGHPAFGSNPALGTSSWAPNVARREGGYELLEPDVQPLKDIVDALLHVGQHERLSLALRRFDVAHDRTRPEDRFIDHWVALEALFLPGISDELSFRASLRIAYYVAAVPDEREEVFHKMRLSYKTRSKVVHGESPKVDLPEIANDTEEIVRRVLRAEVMSPGSLNVDRLDAAIARGGSREQERTLE